MGYHKFLIIFSLLVLAMAARTTAVINNDSSFALSDDHLIEDDTFTLMDSEISHRQLGRGRRYISYEALKKGMRPCKRRGDSYYSCGMNTKANPYRRSCTAITHCKRFYS
ncbi:hypothetical protein ACFE04_020471 [Oxalis oulophora]